MNPVRSPFLSENGSRPRRLTSNGVKIFHRFIPDLKKILKNGGVGIMPTDTIYGIVGSALSRKTVSRIYKLRKRRPDKPMVILIYSLKDLKSFDIKLNARTKIFLKRFWPGKVSIILSCPSKKFSYLHRDTNTLAFRLPAKKNLRVLLKDSGPLVAPSANLEGKPPAQTIEEAQKYFGSKIDFYVDAGKMIGKASNLINLENGKVLVLRK